jgi:hypothetical protein
MSKSHLLLLICFVKRFNFTCIQEVQVGSISRSWKNTSVIGRFASGKYFQVMKEHQCDWEICKHSLDSGPCFSNGFPNNFPCQACSEGQDSCSTDEMIWFLPWREGKKIDNYVNDYLKGKCYKGLALAMCWSQQRWGEQCGVTCEAGGAGVGEKVECRSDAVLANQG